MLRGLYDTTAGCKRGDNSLLKNLLKYDIYVLSETWGRDHDISVPGSEKIILKANKKQQVSGRLSGGIISFYKVHLKGRIHLKGSKNYIWIQLKSCLNELSTASWNIYLCATYIPPDGSPYYSDEIIYQYSIRYLEFLPE